MTFQENVTHRYQHSPGISSLGNGIWQGLSTSIRAPAGNSAFSHSKGHSIPRISIFSVGSWVGSSLLCRHLLLEPLETPPSLRCALNLGSTSSIHKSGYCLLLDIKGHLLLGPFMSSDIITMLWTNNTETIVGKTLHYTE